MVRRAAKGAAALDRYDYLLRGDTRNDIVLDEGDVMFVPVHGTRASVEGSVIRPAIYELEPGETLRDLIAMAGGYRAEASLKRISIARIEPPRERPAEGPTRVIIDVPLELDDRDGKGRTDGADARDGSRGVEGALPNGFTPPVPIEPGDEVTVFAVPGDERGFVELEGAVYHPGRYQWTAGMRLSDLIGLAGGLKPAWYSGRARIVRLDPVDSTRYVVPVVLPADSTSPYPENPVLAEYDLVRIYSRDRFRESRAVSIDGMVNRPASYPFWNGMTLRDLVMLSAGLKDGAYLDSAEVARLPADHSGGRLAVTLKVPLDSTYLLERDSTTYPRLPGLPTRARGTPEVALEPFDHVTVLQAAGVRAAADSDHGW
ncbi:MAG: SLBB domain-containing protein [Gemmatimonadetes bacterium]|nr:SLBB domain-containing protein [Gemmatimonadota bacterium]